MKKKYVNVLKKITSSALAFVMAFSMLSGVIGGITAKAETYPISNPRIEENGMVTWDKVQFGSYHQGSDNENKTPIEWRVLSVDGTDAFLLADKIIDFKKFYEEKTDYKYENSTIRTWLNEDFFNEAFTSEEKQAIMQTKLSDVVSDYIFLLSVNDVVGKYGFDDNMLKSETRVSDSTDFSTAKGSRGSWWLRTPGSFMDGPGWYVDALVTSNGSIYDIGEFVTTDSGIRPALHIDLSKADIVVSGTVSVKKPDDVVATEVDNLITAIGTVNAESKTAIEAARKAYNELSEGAKVKVKKLSVLEDAETKLAEIEKRAKDDAEKEAQDVSSAAEVDKLITAIGNVNAESKTAIEEARKAYNALSDRAKIKVTELATLEAAESKLAEIEKNANNGSSDNKNDDSKKNENVDNNSATSGQQKTTEQQQSTQQTTQQPISTEQPTTEEKVTVPAKTKIASVKNSKSKSFAVIWKKVKDTKGYEVQYALNKKFTKSKKTKTTSKLTLTVKKLKKGSTYYVRVRAYNTDSKGTKVYGKWSAVKKVKIKK